ncbi:hypothetical protein AKJ16_DCAP04902 [Drosera capensis]
MLRQKWDWSAVEREIMHVDSSTYFGSMPQSQSMGLKTQSKAESVRTFDGIESTQAFIYRIKTQVQSCPKSRIGSDLVKIRKIEPNLILFKGRTGPDLIKIKMVEPNPGPQRAGPGQAVICHPSKAENPRQKKKKNECNRKSHQGKGPHVTD